MFGLFRFLAPFKMYLNFLYVGALGVLILLFLGGLVTNVMFIPYVAVLSLGGSLVSRSQTLLSRRVWASRVWLRETRGSRGFSTWCVACSVG